LTAIAGAGRSIASRGQFTVRQFGASTIVTCLDGAVRVEPDGASAVALGPRQQIVYSAGRISAPALVDPILVAGWRVGLVVYRNQPLSQVVAEINRYRPGRIVIADEALSQRRVDAVFHLARIDEALPQIEQLTGRRAAHFPAGLAILG